MSSRMFGVGLKSRGQVSTSIFASLNQYIRDLLIAKDREIRLERKSLADEFYSFAMANSIEMEPGYKYSRVDAAERSMECDK